MVTPDMPCLLDVRKCGTDPELVPEDFTEKKHQRVQSLPLTAAGVVSTGHPVAVPAARDDKEFLERPRLQNINPQGSRVVVWFDDESGVIVSGLHIAAVEKEAPQKAKAA